MKITKTKKDLIEKMIRQKQDEIWSLEIIRDWLKKMIEMKEKKIDEFGKKTIVLSSKEWQKELEKRELQKKEIENEIKILKNEIENCEGKLESLKMFYDFLKEEYNKQK